MIKTIFNIFGRDIVAPVTRRLGTALSAYLVGLGVAEQSAHTIEAGAVVALGLIFDLALSKIDRVS